MDGEYKNAIEFIDALAQSKQVAECMTRNFIAYALGEFIGEANACTLQYVFEGMEAEDRSLVAAFKYIPQTLAFRARRVEP